MGILDRLHTIISKNAAGEFRLARQASVKASHHVEQLEAALRAAHESARASAESAEAAAHVAAAEARAAAQELEIEIKAQAERRNFHELALEQQEPKL